MNAAKPQTSIRHWLLLAALASFAFAITASAQVTSQTTTKHGHATTETQVQRGEVTYVAGNDVVIKMEDGSLKHVTVPDSARATTADGKEVSVHDLQPGMKLEKTIVTTTTPKTVTTVIQAQGKVWHVSPPNHVIISYPGGENKEYKVPAGTKFMVDGQEKTVFDLKKGMNISATVIREVPETHISRNASVTASAPPPPPTPPVTAAAPLLVEEKTTAPAPAPVEQAAATPPPKLPKTGSDMPLIGLAGLLSLAAGFTVRAARRFRT